MSTLYSLLDPRETGGFASPLNFCHNCHNTSPPQRTNQTNIQIPFPIPFHNFLSTSHGDNDHTKYDHLSPTLRSIRHNRHNPHKTPNRFYHIPKHVQNSVKITQSQQRNRLPDSDSVMRQLHRNSHSYPCGAPATHPKHHYHPITQHATPNQSLASRLTIKTNLLRIFPNPAGPLIPLPPPKLQHSTTISLPRFLPFQAQ